MIIPKPQRLSLWDNWGDESGCDDGHWHAHRRGLPWGLAEVVGTVQQVHCSRRRLLRRELEFHVRTIKKSAHTKKRLETYLMNLVNMNVYISLFMYTIILCPTVHMNGCTFVWMHLSIYLSVYLSVYIYILYICMYVCMYVCIYVCILYINYYICIYIYKYTFHLTIYLPIYQHIYIERLVGVYIYIYIYIYIYMYVYYI